MREIHARRGKKVCYYGAVLSLLYGARVQAGDIALIWTFPRDVPVNSFLVTYRSSNDPFGTEQRFRVAYTPEPTCQAFQKDTNNDPDAVCARPPHCLEPGVYSFRVQAERDGQLSEPTNEATCIAMGNCAYDCQRLTQPEGAAPQTALFVDLAPPQPSPNRAPAPTTVGVSVSVSSLESLQTQVKALEKMIPQPPTAPLINSGPT